MTKVLFAAFEAAPFVKTGGLGDVAGSLPKAINNKEFEVRVILPKLSVIDEQYTDQMKFICSFDVPLAWRREYCGLFSLKSDGVTYYFLDNEHYFKRDRVYGEFDDGERAAFYSKAVLESIRYMPRFMPDVIHANDWHAALVPVFLREQYGAVPDYARIKTVYTIHNLKFQGKYSDTVIGDICGLSGTPAENQLRQDDDSANYMQAAALYADYLTTVSPTYADEICMPYYGEGLDWIFSRRRGNSLTGILNGIDTKSWDPSADEYIEADFDAKDFSGKKKDKEILQKEMGLEVNDDIPVFALVSRLTEQKGLDLVTYNLPKLVQARVQLVVLGVGDVHYEEAFSWYAYNFPEKIAFRKEFNNALSHRIYAGADVVLVPSRFEPCGLTQMIAMRYGALPLVRETGGLKDSVKAYFVFDKENKKDNSDIANGFSFVNFNADELMNAMYMALDMWYNDRRLWEKLMKNALSEDFSWKKSAKEYRRLYLEITGKEILEIKNQKEINGVKRRNNGCIS